MAQKTVIKVDVACLKCRKKIFQAVTRLEGLDKIEADDAKGTLTVTGNADPCKILCRCRKAVGRCRKARCAHLVTVGPEPPPKPKEEEKKKPEACQMAQQYPSCMYPPQFIMMDLPYCEPNPPCSIM